jgi:hypothetical protein
MNIDEETMKPFARIRQHQIKTVLIVLVAFIRNVIPKARADNSGLTCLSDVSYCRSLIHRTKRSVISLLIRMA